MSLREALRMFAGHEEGSEGNARTDKSQWGYWSDGPGALIRNWETEVTS